MAGKASQLVIKTVGVGIVAVTIGLGFLGGAGVAGAAPVGEVAGACIAYPPFLPILPEGNVDTYDGVKRICVNGNWVPCSDGSLTPSQKAACAVGLTSGQHLQRVSQPSRGLVATTIR